MKRITLMMKRMPCVPTAACILGSLLSVSQIRAQDAHPAGADKEKLSAYSVIPADVCLAIAVRSYSDLRRKGDKLIKDSGITVELRPSALIDMLFDNFKVRKGLDEDAPFIVMLTDVERIDRGGIVYAVPFTDKAAMAANFGRKAGEFREGQLLEIGDGAAKAANVGLKFSHVVLRGRWFYVGSPDGLEKVLSMKLIEQSLTPDQKKLLPNADMVVHFARAGFEDDWKSEFIDKMEDSVKDDSDPRVQRLAKAMLPLVRNFRLGEIAMRVDEGLAFNGFALFDPKDEVEKALDTVGGGSGASHLTALPEGPVVASFGATGDGRINGDLARDFLFLLTDDFFGMQGENASVDRRAFFGIFDEVWNGLRGSRGALYANVDPVLGGYSALAILDTDDADGFLARVKDLALYVNHASDQLDEGKDPVIEEGKIVKLIENLAADDFRLRDEATTRLALLGEDALPALKKAMDSPDPEVKMRARALHRRLETLTDKRAQDLIEGDVFGTVRPRFIFYPGAEKRGRDSVDIIRFTFAKDATDAKQALRSLFGPEYLNIRLIKRGRRIVLLAGSDLTLLDKALANLEAAGAGLEKSKSLANYRKLSVPVRKAEFHASMARILPVLGADKLRRPAPPGAPVPRPPKPVAGKTPPLTSYGLSIQPSSLAVDWFLPPSELGVYFNLVMGW